MSEPWPIFMKATPLGGRRMVFQASGEIRPGDLVVAVDDGTVAALSHSNSRPIVGTAVRVNHGLAEVDVGMVPEIDRIIDDTVEPMSPAERDQAIAALSAEFDACFDPEP